MADFQIKTPPQIYDVIIVGSGAGGGMAAHERSWSTLSASNTAVKPFWEISPMPVQFATQTRALILGQYSKTTIISCDFLIRANTIGSKKFFNMAEQVVLMLVVSAIFNLDEAASKI